MHASKRHRAWLTGLLALTLIGAACGGGDDNAADGPNTSRAGGAATDELAGTINVSGSSTVAPITSLVADKFAEQAPTSR